MTIGSTRDLTQRFRKLREEAKKGRVPIAVNSVDDGTTAVLINKTLGSSAADIEAGTSNHASDVPPVPPVWMKKAETLRKDFSSLNEQLSKLKEAHQKALLVTFDDSSDAEAHVQVLTKDVQSKLTRLNAEIQSIPALAKESGADATVVGQVQAQLGTALMHLTLEFRREQHRYLNKVEAQHGLTEGTTLGLVESESQARLADAALEDPGFLPQQRAMVDLALAEATDRAVEINRIVDTIEEIATIMRDLAQLVVEQGTMLDRIDRNIEKVAVDVEKGLEEVNKADATQKSGHMKTCILALIVIIAILLIIVIIRHA